MMVELKRRNREMVDEDKNDVEDYDVENISVVRLAWLALEDHISVYLHAGEELVPGVLGIVNWLAHEILVTSSFSWWFPPYHPISVCVALNSTII